MRLFFIFLLLVALVLIPFFIWGDTMMAAFTPEGVISWIHHFGKWGWIAGIVLLMSDLVLPIPATVVMSALGYLYGPITGGFISAMGSFLSGVLGYEICRRVGHSAARWILGEKDLKQGERLYARVGGWLVVLSRWLPVFPEVIACMAGLTRMPVRTFYVALFCASLPLGFAYSVVGAVGVDKPWLAIVLSALLPAALWLIIRPFYHANVRENK